MTQDQTLRDPASDRPALRLAGVSKRYGAVVAVDGIDLDVRAGEFLILLGSSGSGKTTILKMIAGFTRPTEGAIVLADQDVTDLPAHKRDVGMVFQNYALFPHLTVAQNLAFPLDMRKVPKKEQKGRVEQALETVRLPGLGGRYPRELSGGQQQRIAFARAIIYRPRLLLMDEPLGALDKRLREALQLEIKRLHAELGVTVIYVTHDQEEALVLADRVALIERGKIEQLGPGEELYERPSSTFVASFLGESNLFGGLFDASTSRVVFGGTPLRGHVAPGRNLGDREAATIVVRPERVVLCPAGTPEDPDMDGVEGTVTQAIYLGSSVKLELASRDRVAVARIAAGSGGYVPAAGEVVSIRWRADDAIIVPGTPEGAADPMLEDLTGD